MAVRLALPRKQVFQFPRRAFGVAVNKPRRFSVRGVKHRVYFKVVQAVPGQFQFAHHGRHANQDVGAAAVVELIPRHDFFGAYGPAHDVPPLEDTHAQARFGRIRRRHQRVVSGSHYDHVKVRHLLGVSLARQAGANGQESLTLTPIYPPHCPSQ